MPDPRLCLACALAVWGVLFALLVLSGEGPHARSKLGRRDERSPAEQRAGTRSGSALRGVTDDVFVSGGGPLAYTTKAAEVRSNTPPRQIVVPQSESNLSSSAESPRKGLLLCEGAPLDSEVVYWKVVPGDLEYESPITPHHHEHGEKFLTFRYDHAGFNNIRMSFESVVVAAHAMGRTLIFPPNNDHKELLRGNIKESMEMGFEDLMSMKLLQTQRGFHSLTTEEFLRTQGLAGKLKGLTPSSLSLRGDALSEYLESIADYIPGQLYITRLIPQAIAASALWRFVQMVADSIPGESSTSWNIPFLAFPLNVAGLFYGADQDRAVILYDKTMRAAKVLHVKGGLERYRILQHHYSFAYFADPDMASFYKRFIRDFLRYDDPIFCHAARLVAAIRSESLKLNPENNGDYYALHIRRGDIHIPSVKVSAKQILENLRFPDNSSIIPRGAYVYIATDDPDGVCKDCITSDFHPCPPIDSSDLKSFVPKGCLADASWTAFIEAGWHIRFFRDFNDKGLLDGANQHMYAMIESVICSRAKRFSGTLYSTFTGYIHRLRGYHGLGEESYLHAPTGKTMHLRDPQSVGSGWTREWRAGWTDDNGDLI